MLARQFFQFSSRLVYICYASVFNHPYSYSGIGSRQKELQAVESLVLRSQIQKNCEKHYQLVAKYADSNIRIVKFKCQTGKSNVSILKNKRIWKSFRKISLPSVLRCHPCCRFGADTSFHYTMGKASLKIGQKVVQPARDDPSPSWICSAELPSKRTRGTVKLWHLSFPTIYRLSYPFHCFCV